MKDFEFSKHNLNPSEKIRIFLVKSCENVLGVLTFCKSTSPWISTIECYIRSAGRIGNQWAATIGLRTLFTYYCCPIARRALFRRCRPLQAVRLTTATPRNLRQKRLNVRTGLFEVTIELHRNCMTLRDYLIPCMYSFLTGKLPPIIRRLNMTVNAENFFTKFLNCRPNYVKKNKFMIIDKRTIL